MVFVNSMSDLFHEDVPDDYIARVAQVMMEANWHTYQVLTKRADRLAKMLSSTLRFATETMHIWWGVSVEDVKHGKPRIEHIRQTSARVKFLSVEPLLEDLEFVDLSGIDWVIVGGESGPGARPMEKEWVRNLLLCCRRYEVPFFFKQWGGVRKKRAGRELEGRTYDEFPFTPGEAIPDRMVRRKLASDLEAHFKEHEAQNLVGGDRRIGPARPALIPRSN
jgi:protein gp37